MLEGKEYVLLNVKFMEVAEEHDVFKSFAAENTECQNDPQEGDALTVPNYSLGMNV